MSTSKFNHNSLRAIGLRLVSALRYGENARVRANLYELRGVEHPLSWKNWKASAAGRPLKFDPDVSENALTDLNSAVRTILQIRATFEVNFKEHPHVAVGIKHGNSCGAAVGKTPEEAIKGMIDGSPLSLFGGTVITTFPITEVEAVLLRTYNNKPVVDEKAPDYKKKASKRVIAAVAAPEVTVDAMEELNRKSRAALVFENAHLSVLGRQHFPPTLTVKVLSMLGLVTFDEPDTYILDLKDEEMRIHGPVSTLPYERDVALADAVCRTSKSNTITLATHGRIVANAVGGQDRVNACWHAIHQMKASTPNTSGIPLVAASDSFFPFPDGIDALSHGGVNVVFATSGSEKDEAVAKRAAELGIMFMTLPDKKARGFFGHY